MEAIREMNRHRVGSMVAVSRTGEIVGIFTERDVLSRVVGSGRKALETRVADVMTRQVICCSPAAEVGDLARLMMERSIRHIPVIEEDGSLRGVVSIGDINAFRVTDQALTISYLNDYIMGRA